MNTFPAKSLDKTAQDNKSQVLNADELLSMRMKLGHKDNATKNRIYVFFFFF